MAPHPKFDELAKVTVRFPTGEPQEGLVISSEPAADRWIYKISFPDPDNPGGSYENYAPKEWIAAAS